MTQSEMAAALGIPLRTYQHFEIRSPIPAHLVPPFAAIVGRDIAYVIAGERREPI